jgi:hypothetical protein
MRGKFVAGGQIVRFGVEMVSSWLNPAGQVLRAGAELRVDVADDPAHPQVQFVPSLSIETPNGAAPQAPPGLAVATGNGVSNINGVGQTIQVAGDGNAVGNDATITVSVAPAAPSGTPATAVTAPHTASLTSSSGETVSASLGANSISVAISVPDAGQALQQIKGATGTGGGVTQSVRLAGNTQRIHNRMNIYIEIRSAIAGAATAGLRDTFRLLRGL